MRTDEDILSNAMDRRLRAYRRDLALFLILGVVAVGLGGAIFALLWRDFRTDDSELVSHIATGATTLVTTGVGGALLNRVVGLREALREGREWLALYHDVRGPPPHPLLDPVTDRLLNWLE